MCQREQSDLLVEFGADLGKVTIGHFGDRGRTTLLSLRFEYLPKVFTG